MSANCPGCGRFAQAFRLALYDGTWNQEYITTYCAQCGVQTRTTI